MASSFPLAVGRRGALLLLRRALDPGSLRSGFVVISALRRRPAFHGGFGAGMNGAAARTAHSSTSSVVAAAAAAGGGGRGGGAFPSWSSPSSSSSPSPSYPGEYQGGGERGGGGRGENRGGGGARGSWSRDGGGRGGGRRGRDRGDRGDERRGPPPSSSSSPSSPANLLVSSSSIALYGINPVSAALAAGRRELIALHVMTEEGEDRSEDEEGEGGEREEGELRKTTTTQRLRKRPAPNAAAGRGAPARAALSALASSLGARVIKQDKHSLNLITNNASHQGVVLECGPLEWERTASLLEAEEERKESEGGGGGAPMASIAAATLLSSFSSSAAGSSSSAPAPSASRIPVWLVLDQVADPQNLGAVLRSALFLGAAGVLLSPKNCAPASAATSKASAGALEWLRVSAASRPLPALLREAAKEGNWAVLGADAGRAGARVARRTARELLLLGSGARASSAEEGFSSNRSPPAGIALVLGSEGAGLRPVVAAECTAFVKVAGRRRLKGGERGAGSGSGNGGGTSSAAVGSGEGAVDSLNVSVAAALLLHDLLDVFGGDEDEDEEEGG